MRKKFFEALLELARKDPLVHLLIGDLGFGFIEDFQKEFPDRFLNCGIAEQNMIGVASGLALSGKRVFVYSIANFVTMRCFEQIRNCIVAEGLGVTLVGVGGVNAYPKAGISHNCPLDEDIKIMRAIGMEVIVPKNKKMIDYIMKPFKKPRYVRLSR